jgi:hypothetical protein
VHPSNLHIIPQTKKPMDVGAVNHTIVPTGLTIGLGVDLILLSLSKLAIFKIIIRNRNEL